RPLPAPVRRGVLWATWGMAGYVYVLVYSGAYIRHSAAAAACPAWPLCGSTGYAGAGALAIDILHRVLAALAVALGLGLVLLFRAAAAGRRDLRTGGWLLVGALLLQGAAGGYLVLSGFSLLAELAHAAVTGLVFVAVAHLCLLVTLDVRAESLER